jgi:dienelactone hydrolase
VTPGAVTAVLRRRRIAAHAAAAFLAVMAAVPIGAATPAAAFQTEFVPAFPDTPLRGPASAKGAVIWSHGKGFGANDALSPNPRYLALLRDGGWDVFRLNRVDEYQEYGSNQSNMTLDSPPKATRLSESVDRLEAQGYRRVALAGQSYGSWLSLMVAGRRTDLYAVIVNSPAAYGTERQDPIGYQKNATFLYDMVDAIKSGRVMISLFRDDPYSPERRGPEIEKTLTDHHVAHLVIDEPEIPTGHGGGNGSVFATLFGGCVRATLGDGRMPTRAECEWTGPLQPSGEVLLPKDLTIATPGGGAADPFLGKWWGIYGSGRELMLVIERIEGAAVHAVYAYGPDGASPAGMRREEGRIEGGVLIFDRAGGPRLEYRVLPDGTLEGKWIKGGLTLTGLLRRLAS